MAIHKIEKRATTVTMEDWECSGQFCMDHGPFPSSWSLHDYCVEEKDGKVYVAWERYVKPYHIETQRVEVKRPDAKEVERA